MDLAIAILQNRLDALNYAYKKHVENGGVDRESDTAISNRKGVKELEEAINKLKQ